MDDKKLACHIGSFPDLTLCASMQEGPKRKRDINSGECTEDHAKSSRERSRGREHSLRSTQENWDEVVGSGEK